MMQVKDWKPGDSAYLHEAEIELTGHEASWRRSLQKFRRNRNRVVSIQHCVGDYYIACVTLTPNDQPVKVAVKGDVWLE